MLSYETIGIIHRFFETYGSDDELLALVDVNREIRGYTENELQDIADELDDIQTTLDDLITSFDIDADDRINDSLIEYTEEEHNAVMQDRIQLNAEYDAINSVRKIIQAEIE